jgi:hypothetical protein
LEKLQFVCHVYVLDADTSDNNSIISTADARKRRNRKGGYDSLDCVSNIMSGQKTISPMILTDPIDQQPRLFFVFTDLCIRVKGEYRLSCTIMDMNRYCLLTRPCDVIEELITNPFEVYTIQYFPGAPEPTILSKSFWIQGIFKFR